MPGFYTPPPGLELDQLAERIAARVVDMYTTVEAQLMYEIGRRATRGLPPDPTVADQLAVVRDLQATASRLLANMPPDLAQQIITLAVEQGTAAAASQLPLTAGMPTFTGITRTAVESLALVAQDLGNAFNQVHLRILRYPVDAMGVFLGTDIYQQTIARAVPLNLLGTLTQDDVRKRALQDFLDQGVTSFTDKLGRRWRIGSYTEMAVRSAVQRAYTDASTTRMLRNGITTVSILGNSDACNLCAAWFGKILSIDGTPAGVYTMPHATDPNLTVEVRIDGTLDDARAAGWGHPNCACTAAAYFPGLSVPTAAPHYDPAADAAQVKLRGMERQVRDYKRKAGVADAMGDTARVASMRAKVRDKQKQIRGHVAATGQHRKYAREQIRWADGPGGKPLPILPTAAPAPSRILTPSAASAYVKVNTDGPES